MTFDQRAIPLSLSYYTVPELSPPAMIRAAADAGFRFVGLRLLNGQPGRDPAPLMQDAALQRETLACLQGTGIGALDASGARLIPETDMNAFVPFLETAAALGARHVLATGDDPLRTRLIDRFSKLCEQAASLGLTIDLEFVPWMTIRDLKTAAGVVRVVDRDNFGLAIDALHFDRSHSKLADLATLPPRWFRYVQLCDAPLAFRGDRASLMHAAINERLFPGEGTIDLVGLLRALPRGLPVALEVPTSTLARTVAAPERLRRAVAATRGVLASAYA